MDQPRPTLAVHLRATDGGSKLGVVLTSTAIIFVSSERYNSSLPSLRQRASVPPPSETLILHNEIACNCRDHWEEVATLLTLA